MVSLALTQLHHRVRWVVSTLDSRGDVVDELMSPLIAAQDSMQETLKAMEEAVLAQAGSAVTLIQCLVCWPH